MCFDSGPWIDPYVCYVCFGMTIEVYTIMGMLDNHYFIKMGAPLPVLKKNPNKT